MNRVQEVKKRGCGNYLCAYILGKLSEAGMIRACKKYMSQGTTPTEGGRYQCTWADGGGTFTTPPSQFYPPHPRCSNGIIVRLPFIWGGKGMCPLSPSHFHHPILTPV